MSKFQSSEKPNKNSQVSKIISLRGASDDPWKSAYKIPWNDPQFSARMLDEHLSQGHDLASRRSVLVSEQVSWINANFSGPRVLDLGCGPGLYLNQLVANGWEGRGIDFGPASIAYAQEHIPEGGQCGYTLGDLRHCSFGGDFQLALMLFSELNVFSPVECEEIVRKTYEALQPGGVFLIELSTFRAVEMLGRAPSSWYRSGEGLTGLFSDKPHLCLMENHWNESLAVSEQVFHVLEESGEVCQYRSVTKAWSREQMGKILTKAGFSAPQLREDWPNNMPDLELFQVQKPE